MKYVLNISSKKFYTSFMNNGFGVILSTVIYEYEILVKPSNYYFFFKIKIYLK